MLCCCLFGSCQLSWILAFPMTAYVLYFFISLFSFLSFFWGGGGFNTHACSCTEVIFQIFRPLGSSNSIDCCWDRSMAEVHDCAHQQNSCLYAGLMDIFCFSFKGDSNRTLRGFSNIVYDQCLFIF